MYGMRSMRRTEIVAQKLSLFDQLNLPSKQKTVLSKILEAKGQDLSDFVPEAIVYYVNTMLTNPEMLTEKIVDSFKEAWFDGQDGDTSSTILLDRLGFSNAEKTVLSTMVDILEGGGDVLEYVKGLLADAVPSLLDADPEPFEEEGYGRKLLQIWKSGSEDQQPTNTILDELGFVGKRGRIIIECAERYQESVEKFCHDNIISVAEGIIEAPEILGMPISENLLKRLKEDKEKEN